MEENIGDWVILKDDEIIESAIDIKDILKLAEKYNRDEITISKNPSSLYCFYWDIMIPSKESRLTFYYKLPPWLRKKKKIPKEQERYFPFIPIVLYNKSKVTPVIEAIIDSGADFIQISKALAMALGLEEGKKIESSGMGGDYINYETKVGLKIGRGVKAIDIGYVKAFYPEEDKNVPILIGRHPVFEKFKIIFEEYDKKFTLLPKSETKKKKLSSEEILKRVRKTSRGNKFQRWIIILFKQSFI